MSDDEDEIIEPTDEDLERMSLRRADTSRHPVGGIRPARPEACNGHCC